MRGSGSKVILRCVCVCVFVIEQQQFDVMEWMGESVRLHGLCVDVQAVQQR